MDKKEFKILFGSVAKNNGFECQFNGWFKESSGNRLLFLICRNRISGITTI